MSTWLYLECRSHDPVIQDAVEVGQHVVPDLDNVRSWLREREPLLLLVAEMKELGMWDSYQYETPDRYYANTLRFMVQHPKCDIGIRDEYGRDHPLTEETKETHRA